MLDAPDPPRLITDVRHYYTITIMTGLEAIPKISELLARLIKLAKDRETGALVQQIQEHQLEIHTALVVADAKIRDLERQLAEAQVEDIRIHSAVEFRRGKRTGGDWMPFCPKCHMPAETGIALRDARGHFVPAVTCSARCGWNVFKNLELKEIIAKIEA